MSVQLEFEWIDAPRCPDWTEWRTMATLSIEAGNSTVTSVLDNRSHLHRNHVVVPLLHVAEWLVENWWHLWHEFEDRRLHRPGFSARHNLATAGDGFLLPQLEIVPLSRRVELRWQRWKPRYSHIEFIGEGEIRVERAELENQLRNIVDAVLERLRESSEGTIARDALESTWNAVHGLDADEQEFSRAAALLGMDPFDIAEADAGRIARFWDEVDPEIREEALASSTRDTLSKVREWLPKALQSLDRLQDDPRWDALRAELLTPFVAEPWEQGYEMARSVRERLGLGSERIDFGSNGTPTCHYEVAEQPSRCLEGLVAAHGPACVIAPRSENGARFLRARAVGDYLNRSGPAAGILNSLHTERQARSRAFAAEFLAPAQALRARLGSELADEEIIEGLGDEFGVSSHVIAHQMINHQLGTPLLGDLYRT